MSMKFPYILKNSSPHFFQEKDKFYPFTIPSEEKFPEFPWPKSLCEHAHECPVSDALTDMENIYTCSFAAQNGCPLHLTNFDEFAELETIKDVEIFEIGQDATSKWTEKDLDEIVANFESAPVDAPMVALGHGEKQDLLFKAGMPAAGWVSKVRKFGKKLICDFKDMPKLVAEALKNKAYKYVSAEIYPSFLHEGKNIGKVLRRVALVGADIPKIKSLQEVMARYDEGNLDESQKTFWTGAGDIMNEDEKKKQEELDAQAQAEAEKMAESQAQSQATQEALSKFAEQLKTKDAEIAELKAASEKEDPDAQAQAEAEKMAEDQAQSQTATQEALSEFAEQLKTKDAEIAELKAVSERIENEREAERRASHLRDIDVFCEQLKTTKGFSAAVIDEGGIKSLLTSLDHSSPIKFSENEEKTAFDKATEIFSLIAEKAQEGVLTVPLGKLKELEDFSETPKGTDAEGFKMDQKIQKYAEEHKVSYENAYQALYMGGN